jgi:hypothetical protein
MKHIAQCFQEVIDQMRETQRNLRPDSVKYASMDAAIRWAEVNCTRWLEKQRLYPDQESKVISREGKGVRHMYQTYGLLYIEPSASRTGKPVIDSLTRKMTAAFRAAVWTPWVWCGVHTCACGSRSSACDYVVQFAPDILLTNSLCSHYLAYHRNEVPAADIEKVLKLDCCEVEPTSEELAGLWHDIGDEE